MKFNGFPAKMEYSAIPNMFFSAVLPEIGDMAELKSTLYIIAMLYRKRGTPRFVSYKELMGNSSLVSSLREIGNLDEVLPKALKMAAERGTVLHVKLDKDGKSEDIYLLNTESNRQIMAKIQGGELMLEGLKTTTPPAAETAPPPDIFTVYEQNIGVLTPMIAEELLEAEKSYPVAWITDAIKVAVKSNKRSWSYISAVLKRWSAEGKDDGAHQPDSKADPNKYVKGRYGHMVQR
ncbi:MAG: DnaD domain protein [Dehalococcoidales bacterium]|nr:DnaD domain protein [Dehalococcoidales bacterium]